MSSAVAVPYFLPVSLVNASLVLLVQGKSIDRIPNLIASNTLVFYCLRAERTQ
ncbi:hypothetical protein BFJ68_g5234 [Fusarium oxysporum]|uniref:Uncharacterized protein n=1 Tax=Fusarium oxysporum TaxID=5507 RepID=A0A420RG17_FUSOX|nr:hypothetical protein BFJ68_g5234 [Fusarium oxysporum]